MLILSIGGTNVNLIEGGTYVVILSISGTNVDLIEGDTT